MKGDENEVDNARPPLEKPLVVAMEGAWLTGGLGPALGLGPARVGQSRRSTSSSLEHPAGTVTDLTVRLNDIVNKRTFIRELGLGQFIQELTELRVY